MYIELIRHGETVWQKEKRYQGISDVPLSDEGRAKLMPSETKPDVVYVSPLLRAGETADLIFPGAEHVVLSGLAEMDFGSFEGKNFADLQHDREYRLWVESNCELPCPGGEDKARFTLRVCRELSRVLDILSETPEKSIVYTVPFVVHGGTQMAVMSSLLSPRRDYFSSITPCGCGFLLDASSWHDRRELYFIKETCYIRGIK